MQGIWFQGLYGPTSGRCQFCLVCLRCYAQLTFLSVVPLLWWLRSSILDARSLWVQSEKLHRHSVSNHPLRISRCPQSRPQNAASYDLEHELRTPRFPNHLHPLLCRFEARFRPIVGHSNSIRVISFPSILWRHNCVVLTQREKTEILRNRLGIRKSLHSC